MNVGRHLLGCDLNADVGEECGDDEALLRLVTSANIACGGHAGSPRTMRRTLRLAQALNVRVGAHPGYWDRENFGRRDLALAPDEVYAEVLFQVVGLLKLAEELGVRVAYLKPHGALYNQACREGALAREITRVARQCALAVMGLPNSALADAAAAAGCSFIREGFLDRRYRADGSLVPRGEPDALLREPSEALAQAQRLKGSVDSFCVHGDGPQPAVFLSQVLALANVRLDGGQAGMVS